MDIPCVYFICEKPFTNRVKIGKSKQVNIIPLLSLQEMTVLEAQLHRVLVDRRIQGEWFCLNVAEVNQIVTEYSCWQMAVPMEI